MPLDARHPEYTEMYCEWELMRDSHAGERAVKAKGTTYLPATSGMIADGQGGNNASAPGEKAYQAYKCRALFPSFVSEAVKAMIGVMHSKPAVIELPDVMMPLIERATLTGESLRLLLRRINEAQLITGRIGLLADLPSQPNAASIPYIATYDTEKAINWDDGEPETPDLQTLNLVVLDESENVRQADFQWKMVKKYRVLVLGDVAANETSGIYRQGVFKEGEEFNEGALIEPNVRGKKLEQIPFVFINSTDLLPSPIMPPLTELANLCMAIYRGEADYRQGLFMQAQDTLVIIGGDKEKSYRIGPGASINVPIEGDAKFIGANSQGLPEQRQALENDKKRAAMMGAQLLDTTSRQKESGEALNVRVAAQTATLNQIVLAGAEGLQTILRIIAQWIGADSSKVIVKPNVDFAEAGMTPKDFLDLQAAKEKGLPLSDESVHEKLVEHEYTKKSFEDETIALATERGSLFSDEVQ